MTNTYEKIKGLINNNQLQEAASLIQEHATYSESLDQTITKAFTRLEQYETKKLSGEASPEELNIELAQLVTLLVELNNTHLKDNQSYQIPLRKVDEIAFLDALKLEENATLIIIGHTGRYIVNAVSRWLSKHEFAYPIAIKILLKSPHSDTHRRFLQIENSIKTELNILEDNNIQVEVHFYESIPTYRALIYTGSDGQRKSLLSLYKRILLNKTIGWGHSFVVEDHAELSPNPLLEPYLNFFHHVRGIKKTHTLIFDFDDTLAQTNTLQIRAWCEALVRFEQQGRFHDFPLKNEIQAILNDPDLLIAKMTTIFHQYQLANKISEVLFAQEVSTEQSALIRDLNQERFQIREQLTLEQEDLLFGGVKAKLEQLSQTYQLVIISATSEILIRKAMIRNGIREYFSYIFGKFTPKTDWEDFRHKAKLMVQLKENLGVPLNRMIYIGDNHSDYLSTKQVGVKFIEARLTQHQGQLVSLVNYEPEATVYRFSSYEDTSLEEAIREIEQG